mmetsp:Transcript_6782/g.15657  ORF Transcript_6782/g.15657 Transcript_6782/m.15657 type:complete len:292 (-) Transcript_6782:41-916(-)
MSFGRFYDDLFELQLTLTRVEEMMSPRTMEGLFVDLCAQCFNFSRAVSDHFLWVELEDCMCCAEIIRSYVLRFPHREAKQEALMFLLVNYDHVQSNMRSDGYDCRTLQCFMKDMRRALQLPGLAHHPDHQDSASAPFRSSSFILPHWDMVTTWERQPSAPPELNVRFPSNSFTPTSAKKLSDESTTSQDVPSQYPAQRDSSLLDQISLSESSEVDLTVSSIPSSAERDSGTNFYGGSSQSASEHNSTELDRNESMVRYISFSQNAKQDLNTNKPTVRQLTVSQELPLYELM